jgi:hypothetical protein
LRTFSDPYPKKGLRSYDGQRGAMMIVNVNDPSEVPKFAEPWFLSFNADVDFHIVMTPEDLERAGLEKLGKSGLRVELTPHPLPLVFICC